MEKYKVESESDVKTKGYEITSVSKEDIKSLFKEQGKLTKKVEKRIDDMTDSEMTQLASKMADDYVNQLYWSSLEILFEDIFLEG